MTYDSVLQTQSFTQRYDGLTNQLITNCGITVSYNPATHKGKYPDFKDYQALWDTGATGTVITKKVADELGLTPTGFTNSYNANGQCIVNTYLINIRLPNGVGVHTLRVTEGVLTGFDVLIGMDVISRGDFSITCKNGKTVFSFQMPSTHETDFVSEFNEEVKKVHTPITKEKEPGRNEPCPCGSGMKYKYCHGK